MDTAFFVLSKLYWLFGQPDSLLLILLTLAVVVSAWKKRFALLWGVLGLFWLVAAFPLAGYLLYPLDSRFPQPELPQQEDIAGVIVLGGAEFLELSNQWQSLQVNEMGERILVMNQLLFHYPQLSFIYTGGSGSVLNQDKKGADIVKGYFDPLDTDGRIRYERESRNTYENALYSAPLMENRDKPWLLVTSAFHMPRSVGVFRKQGVDVLPYPVDYWSMPPEYNRFYYNLVGNLSNLKMAIREWTGLTAYWLAGKTAEWFPGPDTLVDDE